MVFLLGKFGPHSTFQTLKLFTNQPDLNVSLPQRGQGPVRSGHDVGPKHWSNWQVFGALGQKTMEELRCFPVLVNEGGWEVVENIHFFKQKIDLRWVFMKMGLVFLQNEHKVKMNA